MARKRAAEGVVPAFLRRRGWVPVVELEVVQAQLETAKEKLRRRAARSRADTAAAQQYLAALVRQNAGDVAGTRPEDAARERAWIHASEEYAGAVNAWNSFESAPVVRRCSAGGLSWVLPPDRDEPGTLSHRMLNEGWLPFDDIASVRPFARGEVMLDVGANIGTTSIPRAVLGDFARIYAAEPDLDNYRCLVQNVRGNQLSGRVLPDRVAISSEAGTLHLRKATGMGGHHLLGEPGEHQAAPVRVLTIDTWFERLGVSPGDVRFVKVDTQGWDVRVLEGAPALRARRRAVWQIEVSPAMMKRAGSRPEDLVALVQASFTHVRELGKSAEAPWVPATEMAEVLARMAARRQFGNVLLFNLPVEQ